MYRGPAVQPMSRAPRNMPEGTLPIDGLPPMTLEAMTIKMKNPLQPTPANLKHGEFLFNTTCAPCHGDNGKGDGPVWKSGILETQPKNLVEGSAKYLPDGYIYGAIRDGVLKMPAYGDAMSPDERWDVVMYVRQLEKKAAQNKTAQK